MLNARQTDSDTTQPAIPFHLSPSNILFLIHGRWRIVSRSVLLKQELHAPGLDSHFSQGRRRIGRTQPQGAGGLVET